MYEARQKKVSEPRTLTSPKNKSMYQIRNYPIQFYKGKEKYDTEQGQRMLKYQGEDVKGEDVKGEDVNGNSETSSTKVPIGILYEVIAHEPKAYATINKFQDKLNSMSNKSIIGLSIVANDSLSMPNIQHNSKNSLIHVENVRWGFQTDGNYDINNKGEIPYYSLRRRAAINRGAVDIYNKLSEKCDIVWRRMGDDDLTFHNPEDKNDIQMNELNKVEKDNASIVTFGYNLTSDEDINSRVKNLKNLDDKGKKLTSELIKLILTKLYELEAKFREEIVNCSRKKSGNIDYYPIEPTTYYSFDGDASNIWKEHAEGSGKKQIKEGEALKKKVQLGKQHIFVSNVDAMENTSAKKRNEELIEYFFNKINTRNYIVDKVDKQELLNIICNLQQSYFNPTNEVYSWNQEQQIKFRSCVNEYLSTEKFFSFIEGAFTLI